MERSRLPLLYSAGNGPVSLIAGDFFGAGKTDLVTFNSGDGSLLLLQNTGTRFQAAQVTHSNQSTGIVAGDFNRDGKLDVAVVNMLACLSSAKDRSQYFQGQGRISSMPA